MTAQEEQQGPAVVEGTPESETPVKATDDNTPAAEEATHAESEEGSNAEEKQIEAKESGFDFATLTSCCNFGATKGNCAICQQSIGLSAATVTMKEEGDEEDEKIAHIECYQNIEELKSNNATKIQATYRGTKTRTTLKEEAEREAAEKAAAKKAAAERAASKKQAPKAKKSFAQKLFGGCMGSNSAAVEQK